MALYQRIEGSVEQVLAGRANYAVVCGDAVKVLATLPGECAHVSYTDPSYGLTDIDTKDVIACLTAWLAGKPYVHHTGGMMGHEWDSWVPGPEAWREVNRVLKPGGYCVAYSSTRTADLLGIALRLGGFEMREGWSWLFSGSMAKGLNVSKALDAAAGAERDHARTKVYSECAVYGDYLSNRVCTTCGRTVGGAPGNCHCDREGEPVTDVARLWDGYGTAVKPAVEPILVARKQLDGTVAHNVAKHGCGALNIDAGRISAGGVSPSVARRESAPPLGGTGLKDRTTPETFAAPRTGEQLGRYPAALVLVHDEGCEHLGTQRVQSDSGQLKHIEAKPKTASKGAEVARLSMGHADAEGMETIDEWKCVEGCAVKMLALQSGERKSGAPGHFRGTPNRGAALGAESRAAGRAMVGHSDSGTATRFFYQAKANASDRLVFITCTKGCPHHGTVTGVKEARASSRRASIEHPSGYCIACGDERDHHQHSTVKPLALARYHARLLSLPASVNPIAVVPFCGSGPEARALQEAGFRVIAIDLDPRYCAMTRHRLSQPLGSK